MRINVTLDVGPEEVGAAAQILALIRQLTDHFSSADSAAPGAAQVAASARVGIANLPEVFDALLAPLAFNHDIDPASEQLNALLGGLQGDEEASSASDALLAAFSRAMFNPALVEAQASVEPFVQLASRVPQPFVGKLKDDLVKQAMKVLVIKRPADSDRRDFCLQAEAFALLASSWAG